MDSTSGGHLNTRPTHENVAEHALWTRPCPGAPRTRPSLKFTQMLEVGAVGICLTSGDTEADRKLANTPRITRNKPVGPGLEPRCSGPRVDSYPLGLWHLCHVVNFPLDSHAPSPPSPWCLPSTPRGVGTTVPALLDGDLGAPRPPYRRKGGARERFGHLFLWTQDGCVTHSGSDTPGGEGSPGCSLLLPLSQLQRTDVCSQVWHLRDAPLAGCLPPPKPSLCLRPGTGASRML